MNSIEQRQRHSAVKQLESDTAVVLEGLHRDMCARDSAVEDKLDAILKRERAARHDIIETLRLGITEGDAALDGMIRGLRDRGFWSRLNWLFTGR